MREIFYAHLKRLSMEPLFVRPCPDVVLPSTAAQPRKEKSRKAYALRLKFEFLVVFIKFCFLLSEQQLCVACAQPLQRRLYPSQAGPT